MTTCPSPVLQDRRDDVADPVDDAQDVDAHHELPISGRHVDELCAVHRHAGIVAGNVQLAEIALGLRQRIDDGLLLRNIDPHRHDALVGVGESVRRRLDRLLLDVGHDNIGSGLGERRRDAEADAGGGARDDRGLAGYVDHSSGPSARDQGSAAARIDDDRLAGHRLGAGYIVTTMSAQSSLSAGLFEERGGGGILDLLGAPGWKSPACPRGGPARRS